LFEGLDADGESGRVHEEGAFGVEVADEFFDVAFEVALKQAVGFVQDKEVALGEQVLVSFEEVFEPARSADCDMVAFLIDGVVVLFDKGAADEVADFYLGEF
jgi:hypothetical protein